MTEPDLEKTASKIAEDGRSALAAGRPLLLLVVYQHEAEKLNLLACLYHALRQRGIPFQALDPRHRPEHGTGRLYDGIAQAEPGALALLTSLPARPGTPGLEPTFLEYLNLHRDRISAERLRLILFLHSSEVEQFITEAGDLWDFRHHTYWLERSSSARGPGLWEDLAQRSLDLPLPAPDRQEIDAHIARVHALVEETADPEDKAGLLLDLSRWLLRRYAAGPASEVAGEGLAHCPP
ncbi:MAG: hypothetical protein M3O15_02145, partial [Acidobacteriota bacterium]|nr:hypothetical protein [Acidobacteriota bacterium]